MVGAAQSTGQDRFCRETHLGARDEVEVFWNLTLMEKLAGPLGVTPPTAACAMADGGRYQKTDKERDLLNKN
jgi:hypothetical protein